MTGGTLMNGEQVADAGPRPTSVYLAGPMTGLLDFNRPAFHAAANHLRLKGYFVVNPAELCDEHGTDHPWEWYMRRGIKALVDCEQLVLLPGWGKSKGAVLEFQLAHTLNLRIHFWEVLRAQLGVVGRAEEADGPS